MKRCASICRKCPNLVLDHEFATTGFLCAMTELCPSMSFDEVGFLLTPVSIEAFLEMEVPPKCSLWLEYIVLCQNT